MARKIFKKLDFPTIQRVNWSNADLIRDKGNGKNEDTPSIVYPLMTVKRFMDLREEDKIKNIRNSDEYFLENENLVSYLAFKGMQDKRYKVKKGKEAWYDVEWEDIDNYPQNPDGKEILLHLGQHDDEDRKHRLTIKTSAKSKTEFLFEVIESYDNDIIKEMLDEYEFEKVFVKVLPEAEREKAISIFAEVKYYLEYADEDIFGDAYMDITARFASSGGKKGGEYFTPTDLTKIVTIMRNPKIEDKKDFIFADVTAGACTFMVYAAEHIRKEKKWGVEKINKHVTFVTQEKEKNSEIFGKLNLAFHGYENHISYNANTITNWKKDHNGNDAIGIWEGKIDCILANPPYGLNDYGFDYAQSHESVEERWIYGIPPKGEGEYAFLQSIISLLNEKGEAAVIFPLGTQFKDSTKNIREKIIEIGIVEAIVNMPSGMFLTTAIPVCVWFLKKGRSKEEIEQGIYMMDASECFEKEGKNNKIKGPKAEKVKSTFLKKLKEQGFSDFIPLSIIKDNLYNLSVSRYIFRSEDKNDINISDLNRIISDKYNKLLVVNNKLNDLFKDL